MLFVVNQTIERVAALQDGSEPTAALRRTARPVPVPERLSNGRPMRKVSRRHRHSRAIGGKGAERAVGQFDDADRRVRFVPQRAPAPRPDVPTSRKYIGTYFASLGTGSAGYYAKQRRNGAPTTSGISGQNAQNCCTDAQVSFTPRFDRKSRRHPVRRHRLPMAAQIPDSLRPHTIPVNNHRKRHLSPWCNIAQQMIASHENNITRHRVFLDRFQLYQACCTVRTIRSVRSRIRQSIRSSGTR